MQEEYNIVTLSSEDPMRTEIFVIYVGGYIGESMRWESEYAKMTGKASYAVSRSLRGRPVYLGLLI